jgi:hypothetical protein
VTHEIPLITKETHTSIIDVLIRCHVAHSDKHQPKKNTVEGVKGYSKQESLLSVSNNACSESRAIITTPSHKHHPADTQKHHLNSVPVITTTTGKINPKEPQTSFCCQHSSPNLSLRSCHWRKKKKKKKNYDILMKNHNRPWLPQVSQQI